MTTADSKTCSRPGCDKKLYSNNTSGVCATGCRSPEAPPAKQGAGRGRGGSKKPAVRNSALAPSGAVERFRVVAEALGLDPDGLLEEFAASWLEAVKEKVA